MKGRVMNKELVSIVAAAAAAVAVAIMDHSCDNVQSKKKRQRKRKQEVIDVEAIEPKREIARKLHHEHEHN
jgi:translation initiation factor IF-3